MLSISIVLYHPDWEGEVKPLVNTLLQARRVEKVYLIDNSQSANLRICEFAKLQNGEKIVYRKMEKNVGYGAGHNVALRETTEPLHLVMNSDILLKAEDIEKMVDYMESHPEVMAMMPHVVGPDGKYQGLCRTLPSPWDLIKRRFLHQKSSNVIAENDIPKEGLDIPYLSGCCMLLRTEAVRRVGYFDERFFLYPEDVDLSRRLHELGKTLYWPGVSIVHNHRQASYHSTKMLWIHVYNMIKYYNKWGWFYKAQRR